MKNKFNILLATDYSESVMNAERYAIQFAKDTGSGLVFLHVFSPPLASQLPSFDAEKIEYNPGVYELNKLRGHVDSILKSLAIKPGELNIEYRVREGNVAKQTAEEAKSLPADFIFTGTHLASVFRELFLGSHTWSIMKTSGIPVLAIPEDALYTKVKHIAYATEYHDEDIRLINNLTDIALLWGSEITVFHVTNYVLSKEFERKYFEEFREKIRDNIAFNKINMRLLQRDNVIDGLNDFCEHNKASWLVMSFRKEGILDKVFNPMARMTKKMSFHNHIPLLAMPDSYSGDFSVTGNISEMDYSENEE